MGPCMGSTFLELRLQVSAREESAPGQSRAPEPEMCRTWRVCSLCADVAIEQLGQILFISIKASLSLAGKEAIDRH